MVEIVLINNFFRLKGAFFETLSRLILENILSLFLLSQISFVAFT